MNTTSLNVTDIMRTSPVIPVIVIDDLSTAVPLAEALVEGGLRVLEITLRTNSAFEAIERVAKAVPDAIVGVGTITEADEVQRSMNAGAKFAVSPGYTHALGTACKAADLPFLPGIATPADILRAQEDGYQALKFFPAEQAGGVAMLKALSGPFINAVFCPTGGVGPDNVKDYLALDNVLCVGGSWVAPGSLVKQGDWAGITALAQAANALS